MRGEAGVPNTLAPNLRARIAPITNPIAPPAIASSNCSARNIPAMRELVAPSAFITPISARRSRTVVAEVAATAKAAAPSAASVTIHSRVPTRENTAFRVGHAANGAHVRARQYSFYLEADGRNVWRTEPAIVFRRRHFWGSRSENASAGFVSALTKSCRNSPGCPDNFCAMASGTSKHLSVASSVETIPTTLSEISCAALD